MERADGRGIGIEYDDDYGYKESLFEEDSEARKGTLRSADVADAPKKSPKDAGGRGKKHEEKVRKVILDVLKEGKSLRISEAKVCKMLRLSQRSVQRWRREAFAKDKRQGAKHKARSYSEEEREKILELINAEEFSDFPPAVIVAKLADQGRYVCSESTMYRILRANKMLKHRRRSKKPEYGTKLEAVACAPNQVWCWDITFLPSPIVGVYFKLYLLLDIFSRKVVGYCVADTQDAEVALAMIKNAINQEGISGVGLRLHNDNGNLMKTYVFTERIKALGVLQSRSRPMVSNDNPFVEAFFKTMKYDVRYTNQPFKNIEAASAWVDKFVPWYNGEHMHSGLNYLTPEERHSGRGESKLARRAKTSKAARDARPEMWSKAPKSWELPKKVEINAAGCRAVR